MSQSGLDTYPLGCTAAENHTVFRLFAPDALTVSVIIFEDYEHEDGEHHRLEKNQEGIWQSSVDKKLTGNWYAYNIEGPQDSPFFESTPYPVADPWSRHVTSRNHYLQFPKTMIPGPDDFDWEGDSFVNPEDPRDLVIYETHIKDMVAHSSAKTYVQGIYNDFREAEVGGISHLKQLGVNAVEFLPLQKFAYFEPPYCEDTPEGIHNTWNPYSRNYWGYMTSFYFAPETIYASDAHLDPDAVVGKTAAAQTELKSLVKSLHQEGISVIMDVVYNHASHYDLNPLKYTAKGHYFRLDEDGNFLNDSWTGNDINTRSHHSRALIVESIKYWMNEFHIDGFRFDLAGIIDWETVEMIRQEARKINPKVILIAEPWGGEYKPEGFSDRGWASWNDRIRNTFKGYNPLEDRGLIFGHLKDGETRFSIENIFRGTLQSGEGGLFHSSAHAVNYLESHDRYTLGDYIRIALNPAIAEKVIEDKTRITPLTKKEMKIAKLAAMALFVSQGITMIHAGQEWARSKVIEDHAQKDPERGMPDYDSYNKDNETNWLNFNEIKLNEELFNFYRALIAMRLNSPALRKAQPDDIEFKVYHDPLHITFSVQGDSSGDRYDYFISLNMNSDVSHEIILPEGDWEIVLNSAKRRVQKSEFITHRHIVKSSSGIILRKLRVSKA